MSTTTLAKRLDSFLVAPQSAQPSVNDNIAVYHEGFTIFEFDADDIRTVIEHAMRPLGRAHLSLHDVADGTLHVVRIVDGLVFVEA